MLRSMIAAAGLLMATSALAEPATRAQDILERFRDANQWRDHVMVAAHRAGGLMGGKRIYPENSMASLRAMIDLGVEMVELDVQKTRDNVFVVLHDSWLDRTTTCRGRLVDYSFAELAGCRLVVEGTGKVTNEGVPTLQDMLEIARGRILVNIDNKLDADALGGMVEIARRIGVADQIVVKQNLWNGERIVQAQRLVDSLDNGASFMPIIADDAVTDTQFLEQATNAVGAHAVELITWRNDARRLTHDGGVLFSSRARAIAARGNWHLWVNTYAIVNKPGGYLSGGRGDELAVSAGLPDEVYGFWVDRGATIIQTDEPKAAMDWLNANAFRVPYAVDQVTTAAGLSQ
ncbi:MAG: glycerophosphodiester phosphodiesterase family protein [Rhizobiaceae bacterium]|nr:glycerophosphodiester phosphodiesterase family protein [Rhizobiaceae bacterium]